MADLTSYGGHDVLNAGMRVRKLGDGLSKAINLDPVEIAVGSRVYLLVEGTVVEHDHKRISGTDCLSLIHVVDADTSLLVDESFARTRVEQMRERIKLAEEAKHGIQRLPEDKGKGNDEPTPIRGARAKRSAPGTPAKAGPRPRK